MGPWPLGPMGPHIFVFLKICKMVWDLSRSVPMVFRRPGNPLIKLFHFIFNWKCDFVKVSFFLWESHNEETFKSKLAHIRLVLPCWIVLIIFWDLLNIALKFIIPIRCNHKLEGRATGVGGAKMEFCKAEAIHVPCYRSQVSDCIWRNSRS